jgi:hypothetical protein
MGLKDDGNYVYPLLSRRRRIFRESNGNMVIRCVRYYYCHPERVEPIKTPDDPNPDQG